MMTLEKFEEASELVKKVTNPTKLVFSEYADGSKSISETGKYAAYRSIQDQGSLL